MRSPCLNVIESHLGVIPFRSRNRTELCMILQIEPEKIIQEDYLATLLLQFSDQEDGQNLVKIVKLLKISGVQSKLLSNDASLFQYLSKGTDWTFHKVTLQTFSCFFSLTFDFEVLNSKIG